MKFVAIPYIEGIGSVEYKKVLTQKFELDFIYGDTAMFYGWYGMEMAGGWNKIENLEDKVTLEFYDTHYHILKKRKSPIKYCFPYPRTLNEFISDCGRCDVKLWWGDNAIIMYLPRVMLSEKDIDTYYKEVLHKIGKS